MQATTEKHWYLVQCKPKQDFRALEHLQHQGYECLLPTRQIEQLRNGQWSSQEEPLFPGYLFIELATTKDNWMSVRSTRGVRKIVSFGITPSTVPTAVIDQLRTNRLPIKPKFIPGEKIIVDYTGMDGMEAIFIAKDGEERVLILLKILNRQIKTTTSTSLLKSKK